MALSTTGTTCWMKKFFKPSKLRGAKNALSSGTASSRTDLMRSVMKSSAKLKADKIVSRTDCTKRMIWNEVGCRGRRVERRHHHRRHHHHHHHHRHHHHHHHHSGFCSVTPLRESCEDQTGSYLPSRGIRSLASVAQVVAHRAGLQPIGAEEERKRDKSFPNALVSWHLPALQRYSPATTNLVDDG